MVDILQMSLDSTGIEERLDGMLQRLDHFKRVDVGATMSNWQTQDMHRQKPFTMRYRARGKAVTKVRPHSLYEVKRSALHDKYLRRHHKLPDKTSVRPIIRAELVDELISRETDAMHEKIHW